MKEYPKMKTDRIWKLNPSNVEDIRLNWLSPCCLCCHDKLDYSQRLRQHLNTSRRPKGF